MLSEKLRAQGRKDRVDSIQRILPGGSVNSKSPKSNSPMSPKDSANQKVIWKWNWKYKKWMQGGYSGSANNNKDRQKEID